MNGLYWRERKGKLLITEVKSMDDMVFQITLTRETEHYRYSIIQLKQDYSYQVLILLSSSEISY